MTNPFAIIPARVRAGLYLVYALGSIVVTYLAGRGTIGANELTAWAGLGTVLGFTAASNVDVSDGAE